jgi:hypothetical protein
MKSPENKCIKAIVRQILKPFKKYEVEIWRQEFHKRKIAGVFADISVHFPTLSGRTNVDLVFEKNTIHISFNDIGKHCTFILDDPKLFEKTEQFIIKSLKMWYTKDEFETYLKLERNRLNALKFFFDHVRRLKK